MPQFGFGVITKDSSVISESEDADIWNGGWQEANVFKPGSSLAMLIANPSFAWIAVDTMHEHNTTRARIK